MELTEERPANDLAPVSAYERPISASIERIWENVLDWEHLPWLHRTSFSRVDVLEESPGGWRAWVGAPRGESLVDVRLDRPALRYLTRTLDGLGAGTEIATGLEPVGERTTKITVEFRVPPASFDPTLGRAYVRLYTRLWNEDEAMMVRRQAVLDANGGRLPPRLERFPALPLGPFDELRRRLPLVVRAHGRELRLVALDGEIVAHPAVCPHLGGPLEGAAIEDGCIVCPWHGYRYDVRSGRNARGRPVHLGPPLRVRVDGRTGEATLEERP